PPPLPPRPTAPPPPTPAGPRRPPPRRDTPPPPRPAARAAVQRCHPAEPNHTEETTMTTATRLLTSLVVLATCLAGLGSTRPEWLAGLGQSWRQLADGRRRCAAAGEQAAALCQREEVVVAPGQGKTPGGPRPAARGPA